MSSNIIALKRKYRDSLADNIYMDWYERFEYEHDSGQDGETRRTEKAEPDNIISPSGLPLNRDERTELRAGVAGLGSPAVIHARLGGAGDPPTTGSRASCSTELAKQNQGGAGAPLLDTLFPNSLYLDVGDNVHANVCTWLESNCGDTSSQWFIPGECENGHRIAKVISCGKEWCPVCSKVGSFAHNRRYVRWLPKIQQFERMRYLVFTIPEDLRINYRTKEALTELGRKLQVLLKKLGFKRGLRRWHWFGDRSNKWHPHLNVLMEGGYFNKATIEAIKQGWAKILKVEMADVHASYKARPADMAGCLHYVTRATFLDYNWDIEMALELRNFRNMVVWGRDWQNEPVWEADKNTRIDDVTGEKINVRAIESIVNGSCHVCGAKIHWTTALPAQILGMVDKESLGAGYFTVTSGSPPKPEPESLALTIRRRCTELANPDVAKYLHAKTVREHK